MSSVHLRIVERGQEESLVVKTLLEEVDWTLDVVSRYVKSWS